MNICVTTATLSAAILIGGIARGQSTIDFLGITIEQKADLSPAPYSIWLGSPAFVFDEGHVIAPDGTVLYNDPAEFTYISGLSQTQLTSRFAGIWTLYSAPASQALEQHQFSISASLLLNSFPEAPSIVWPLEGDVVHRKFEVLTDFGSIQLYGGGGSFRSLGPGHTEVLLDFPAGVDQQPLGIRAYSNANSPFFAATATTPDPARSFLVNVSRRTYSPERTITVLNVPEPAACLLSLVAAAAVPLRRRR